ncbi:ferric reductase [Methanolobus halotolerans]|uniref:Ferric reductase n=1 Tax=Methanolobus halotolerans TaxID=2052935 RepID=A0A4E0Q0G6_9EURY|nr:ferric reductase [Methanolobus halotolerans]TGC11516.1 ferric reductase [Methanolobus halotolerans]
MKYESGVIISFLVIVLGIILYFLFQESDIAVRMTARAAGLLGYFFLFLAILSSEYLASIRKTFGRSFINVHHHLARVGVALVLVHPITVAYQFGLSAFLPVFYPLAEFLRLAGRPAFYIILIAVLAGIYRKRIPKNWRSVHALNYLAFLMVFIHAWLIGTDLQNPVMQLIWISMALIVVAVFIHKHLISAPGRKKGRK